MISRRSLIAGAGAGIVASTPFATVANAAPKSRLIDRHWLRSGSGAGPDHADWSRFLSRRVRLGGDGVARMDYAGGRTEHNAVKGYVARLEKATPTTMSRAAAFAYWVNLYNAATVMLVLDAYPVDTIKKVRGGVFNTGPWDVDVVKVEGRALSLDDIEHGVLRPIWRDPRIHYAVNCASIGCPNLLGRAWRSQGLSAALNKAARAYVNHPRGARIRNGRLIVSSIYHWFKEDFGDSDAGVIAHLRAYAAPKLKSELAQISSISDHTYDWALNS